ncbi:unnamed protein product [Rotaria sp. Silwood1]|nr:unnamed protein product [Rotaria sp. Silwood1]CAF3459322.1 unnamed protein product [Rotaria sp. Silwood1]CAF3462318.1 unnamed protein product [Rotaria sp. Silwood1]CAF4575092.1 unnamed protein product [Rotaria sp. Silwood1]CAF4634482.1 unnamed protein product [Rotaria sp. Silwood1]
MNVEKYTRRTRCAICSRVSFNKENTDQNPCETYLLQFLIELQEKLDNQNKIDEHFSNSIFDDEDDINQTSCNGLTLMHINVLGGRNDSSANDSEEENNTFVPLYEESIALKIYQVLLKRGASPNGNSIYEMRPLHIAIRRQWLQVSRLLLEAGANPNVPEKDIYASQPMDIAVLNDDPEMIELLHQYGASINGFKSMFHLTPLAEAFTRGYFDVFKILLELGAKPILNLDRNIFRSFGTQLFDTGIKGRRHFIQLMYDHGGNIESQFKLHAMRVEPDGIIQHQPRLKFSCDPICIADLDSEIFKKWICESRSLKELCRLTLRRYFFNTFDDGFKRLSALKFQIELDKQLYSYIMFNKKT